jgi:Flp pilus assembly protein TadD
LPCFEFVWPRELNRGGSRCQRGPSRVRARWSALALAILIGAAGPALRAAPATGLPELRAQARAALASGDPAAAVGLLRAARTLAPREPDPWNDLGLAFAALGSADSAQACYERAIRLAPERSEAHLNLAVLLMRGGKTGRARSEFEEAVQAAPGRPDHYVNFAAALTDVGKPEAARPLLAQALELDPEFGPAHAEIGRVEARAGRPAQAVAHFARAESLGVASPTFDANFGLALLQAGAPAAAEARLAAALAADSTRAATWNHLGVARLRQGRAADALESLSQARRLAPADEDIRANLGQTLLRLERYDDLAALLCTPPPVRADLLALRGLAARGRGRPEEALQYMREAARRAPRDAVIQNNYGIALAEAGDLEAAIEVWRDVLVLDPANTAARDNLKARGAWPDSAAPREATGGP